MRMEIKVKQGYKAVAHTLDNKGWNLGFVFYGINHVRTEYSPRRYIRILSRLTKGTTDESTS